MQTIQTQIIQLIVRHNTNNGFGTSHSQNVQAHAREGCCSEPSLSEINKYIQLAFYYIKERKEFLDIHHVRTELMVSDMLTKSVSIQVYDALVGWLTGTAKPYSFTPPRVFK